MDDGFEDYLESAATPCGLYDQHPQLALPPRTTPNDVVVCIVRRQGRWAVKHPNRETPAESNWFGHAFLIFRAEGEPDQGVAFYPRFCLQKHPGDREIPARIAEAGYLRKYVGRFPSITQEMWRCVEGRVKDDYGLHFDSCSIYPLTRASYENAMRRVDYYQNTPPRYQVTGLWDANCVRMLRDILERAGVRTSTENALSWIAPWPIYESARIETLGRVSARWNAAWRSLTGRQPSSYDPIHLSGNDMIARVKALASPSRVTDHAPNPATGIHAPAAG